MKRRPSRAGFTLLEVMLAVAIMAISLAAIFSAEAGAVKMAHRARKLSFATLLARCKMGELEEDLMKKGLPAAEQTDTDECCKDAPIDGFKCRSEVIPIVLPDSMFNGEEDEDGKGKKGGAKPGTPGSSSSPGSSSASSDGKGKGGLTGMLGAAAAALGVGKEGEDGKAKGSQDKDKDGKDKDGKDKKTDKEDPQDLLSGDPSRFLSGGGGDVDGISAMAMQYVYPILKPSLQSQIRRVSVTVEWSEGNADKTFDLTQYFVAEQPVPLATDPDDPNATGTGTGTGIGTGTGTGTGASTGKSAFGSTP